MGHSETELLRIYYIFYISRFFTPVTGDETKEAMDGWDDGGFIWNTASDEIRNKETTTGIIEERW